MIPLHAYGTPHGVTTTVLGRISTSPVTADDRPDTILATINPPSDVSGYAGVITTLVLQEDFLAARRVPVVHALKRLDHLASGDVVSLNPQGYVRTLYRQGSRHNALFATDMCNSYCLMCSQPPKAVNDRDRVGEHLRLLDLIDPSTESLGITGGEPTLLGSDLLRIVAHAKDRLPRTSLHVLTNGRLFYYGSYAELLARIEHPNLVLGIPLYADVDAIHDHVVQALGAFDETLVGLQNLGRFGVPVEVRVVLHRLTIPRLPQLAEFIYRNLTFACHVALMGLEWTGFTLANQETLWIDPWEYRDELTAATLFLADRGMSVSIYNHQLCTIPEILWPFARRSISDWKNEYHPICGDCDVRGQCGGFFTWNLQQRISTHIRPVRSAEPGTSAAGVQAAVG